jgi:hypothetical protein
MRPLDFEVEPVRLSSHHGPRFRRRQDPEGDLAAYVDKSLGQARWNYRARVKVHAPAEQVIARVPPAVVVETLEQRTCFVDVGSDTPRTPSIRHPRPQSAA